MKKMPANAMQEAVGMSIMPCDMASPIIGKAQKVMIRVKRPQINETDSMMAPTETGVKAKGFLMHTAMIRPTPHAIRSKASFGETPETALVLMPERKLRVSLSRGAEESPETTRAGNLPYRNPSSRMAPRVFTPGFIDITFG